MATGICAQEPERPVQEVFESELVYPQERGEIQITSGFRSQWWRGEHVYTWPVQMEYGIKRNLQVQMEWEGPARRGGDATTTDGGIADFHVGAKYSFLRIRNSNWHGAVAAEIGIPAGSVNRGFSDGFLEYEPSVMVAKDFPRWGKAQVFSQAGIGLVQRLKSHIDPADDEPAAHELNWSGGLFVPCRRMVATTEFAWRTNRWNHQGQQNELYVTPGSVWKFSGWEFGIATPVGINSGASRLGLILKLTREFESKGD